MSKIESQLEDFQKASKRFSEVLQQKENEFIRDSAIQRFEFTFDIAWKALKTFLEEYYNASCASPRACFREAFHQGVIEYDERWIEMTNWRNTAVHTYKEKLAEELYKKLPIALKYFQILLKKLKEIKE